MTATTTAPTSYVDLAPSSAARKVAAGASALFGVALFMTVASIDVPHRATDAELVRWWQQSGNRMSGIVSGLSAICAAVLITVGAGIGGGGTTTDAALLNIGAGSRTVERRRGGSLSDAGCGAAAATARCGAGSGRAAGSTRGV